MLAVKMKTAETSDKDLSELEQYWKAVRDNPTDFTGWTYLLQYIEQEVCLNHIHCSLICCMLYVIYLYVINI